MATDLEWFRSRWAARIISLHLALREISDYKWAARNPITFAWLDKLFIDAGRQQPVEMDVANRIRRPLSWMTCLLLLSISLGGPASEPTPSKPIITYVNQLTSTWAVRETMAASNAEVDLHSVAVRCPNEFRTLTATGERRGASDTSALVDACYPSVHPFGVLRKRMTITNEKRIHHHLNVTSRLRQCKHSPDPRRRLKFYSFWCKWSVSWWYAYYPLMMLSNNKHRKLSHRVTVHKWKQFHGGMECGDRETLGRASHH